MPSPLWRHAPGRAWRRGGSGLLLVVALTAATASAASVPMFAALAGDAALTSVLAAVPDDARTADAAAVRLVGGNSPRSADQARYLDMLAAIPGLSSPRVSGRSVGPDINYASLFRPLVRANGIDVRARLMAVEDPAAQLGVTSGAARPGAVWLPDPVAAELGVGAGDEVDLLVQTFDAVHPRRKGMKPPVVDRVPVAGTYAVGPDGRRPADVDGPPVWSRRLGWLPTDSDLITLPAHLVVGDVATIDAIAQTIGDPALWSVESTLEPGLSLEEAEATAAGVAELRRFMRSPDAGQPSGPLRLGLVSGIEPLVAQAGALASATAARGELLAAAGVAAGLLAALVIAVLMALDRRRELVHGAGTGVGPIRTAGLWAIESVVPAAAAVIIGTVVARATMALAGPQGRVPDTALGDGLRRAVLAAVAGLLLVAAVGAAAVLVAERASTTARPRRVPWVPVLVAGAAVAVVATLTTPATTAGPVALAVPALVAAAAGACLALAASWLARRAARATSAALPTSVAVATGWLALRRLGRPGADQPAVVAVVAVGLGMVVFALSAVAATQVTVADRVAVASGAVAAASLEGSWQLDPDAPALPTTEEIAAGVKVPTATTPAVPDGMALVWRTLVTVEGQFGSQPMLVADPAALDDAASWGQGSTMQQAREALAVLDAADRAVMAAPPTTPVPVIAAANAGFLVGDELTVSGQEWSTPVRVVASVSAFPASTGGDMLVAASPSFFRSVARWDPRLAPPDSTTSPRPYYETWLWSSRPADEVTAFLDSHEVAPSAITTAAQSAQAPTLVAAERSLGYQVALAGFLAVIALVAAAVHARRLARRSRGPDALLARVGLGRRGVAIARTWEVVVVALVALVAAVLANVVVAPLGPLLLDLDRGARPGYELHLTGGALLAACLLAVSMTLLALLAGVRPMLSRRGPTPEEVVLRDDG